MMLKNKPIYKIMTGVVVKSVGAKTISVEVSVYKNHPIYQKRYLSSKKYLVHDQHEQAKIGDRVRIIACRPLSRHKRFRLLK